MDISSDHPLSIAVSGIPRGFHDPLANGNWLQAHHKAQILAVSPRVHLIEIPAREVKHTDIREIEVLLAEGGNRTHYAGELDWDDYLRFFTPALKWVQLCSTGFSDNITPEILEKRVTLTNAPGLHTLPIAESVLAAMLAHAKNFKQRRQDQAAQLGIGGQQLAAQVDPAAVGQADVQDGDVGPRGRNAGECLGHRGGLADYGQLWVGAEEVRQPATHDFVIVNQEHLEHTAVKPGRVMRR